MAIKSSDQISVVDLTDGYSVILTNDSYTFAGSTSAAKPGETTTTVIAMRGSVQVPAGVVNAEITAPAGVTTSVDTDTSTPTITISVDATVTEGGTVDIPVSLDNGGIVIHKSFTFGIAYTGATGAAGAAGKGITNVTNYFLSTSASSGVTTSTAGWSTTPAATTTTNRYLWCYQRITYTDNTTSDTTPAIIGTHGATGATGASGADAITLTITSSNGTIFKNSAITTVLTAHVYKAGTEVTGSSLTALGTIKWYKDGGSSPVATGQTLNISAGDVTNKATYIAQLEG